MPTFYITLGAQIQATAVQVHVTCSVQLCQGLGKFACFTPLEGIICHHLRMSVSLLTAVNIQQCTSHFHIP